jgi:hypothetical protein
MKDSCDIVIRSLEDHPSRLNKEAIIEAEKDNTELFEGFQLAIGRQSRQWLTFPAGVIASDEVNAFR